MEIVLLHTYKVGKYRYLNVFSMELGTKNSLVEIGSNIAGGIVAKSLSEVILPGSSILGEVIGPVVTAVTGDIALA